MDGMDESRNSSGKFKMRIEQKIVEEIIISEENYVKNLKIIVNYFLEPILSRFILNLTETKTIFGDIRSILQMNEELLSQLKSGNIPEAFLTLAPFLKVYSTYANNYEAGNISLQNLIKTRPKLNEFLKSQETRSEVQSTLTALLIQPIQRIPKYKLLLNELLKHCFDSSKEIIIKDALIEIERIAEEMNKHIHVGERMRRMIEIQKSLIDDQPKIIDPARYLIKEGPLQKVCKNGRINTRYFFLFNDMLLYCKQQSSSSKNRIWLCRCVLPIRHCRVMPTGGDGNRQQIYFKVTCRDVELNLLTDYNEGKAWIDALSSATSQFVENRRTLRKTSTIIQPPDSRIQYRLPRPEQPLGVIALSSPMSTGRRSPTCPVLKLC